MHSGSYDRSARSGRWVRLASLLSKASHPIDASLFPSAGSAAFLPDLLGEVPCDLPEMLRVVIGTRHADMPDDTLAVLPADTRGFDDPD